MSLHPAKPLLYLTDSNTSGLTEPHVAHKPAHFAALLHEYNKQLDELRRKECAVWDKLDALRYWCPHPNAVIDKTHIKCPDCSTDYQYAPATSRR